MGDMIRLDCFVCQGKHYVSETIQKDLWHDRTIDKEVIEEITEEITEIVDGKTITKPVTRELTKIVSYVLTDDDINSNAEYKKFRNPYGYTFHCPIGKEDSPPIARMPNGGNLEQLEAS